VCVKNRYEPTRKCHETSIYPFLAHQNWSVHHEFQLVTETGHAGPFGWVFWYFSNSAFPETSWDSTNLIRIIRCQTPQKRCSGCWWLNHGQNPRYPSPWVANIIPNCPKNWANWMILDAKNGMCLIKIGWQCKAKTDPPSPNLPCYTMFMGGINIYKLSLKYALWHWEYHHDLSLPPKPWGESSCSPWCAIHWVYFGTDKHGSAGKKPHGSGAGGRPSAPSPSFTWISSRGPRISGSQIRSCTKNGNI